MSTHEEEVLGKAYDSRLMKRLLTYLRPYKALALCALVVVVSNALLQLAEPYLVKLAIDRYIASGDLPGVNRIILLFFVVLLGSFICEFGGLWLMQTIGQKIMFDLRMQIYGHLQRLSLSYYDRNPVGRLMTRVTSDVDVLNDLFSSGMVTVFGDIVMLTGIVTVLLTLDWRLALVAFSVLPLIVLLTAWFRRHVRESYRTVRTLVARINAFLQENITGMATVQLFRREPVNFARFDEINKTHRNANLQSIFYYAVFYPAIEIIGALAGALIIWIGGGFVLSDTLTLGTLVAFLQYSERFFRPITDMSEKFNLLQGAMASSERIFALLDAPITVSSPERPVVRDPASLRGHITFDHVWFAYAEDNYVLRDISFDVRPGERIGIVGATGAGKSTVINLLLRFYDVTRGRVLIDGVDVREMPLADVRQLFGLVLQDVYLFTGTIASNVRLGRTDITDAEVRAAIDAVHADRFVDRLPAGTAAPVAERGATLSVGQKQLLSFARALAFNPRVLVLDEATSSVDTETELLIRDALRRLMANRTTIAIAHRLSTIQDMDKILVFHKGELREAGTHQELLARRGVYYKLYQLQYKDQEVASLATGGDA